MADKDDKPVEENEPVATPAAESPSEPVTAPEPAAEPTDEVAAEPEPEPAAAAEPQPVAESEPVVEPEPVAEDKPAVAAPAAAAARERPAVPGADLEVDIVPEGVDPLASSAEQSYSYAEDEPDEAPELDQLDALVVVEPIEAVAIDLGAGARYRATGKRKTAIARVTLRPGSGTYTINGRSLEAYFPRDTLQRNIRQPLETVGYEQRMDVVARMQGGGVSSQAGALRHGISRALLEADPNLRGELKRRGFLTRDARAKERKKAGLKKARKRPQFSKR
jgi:small subunit ribosomal protein S9